MNIAVVIPCYRVKQYVMGVLDKMGTEVKSIYCVDDACPENSGQFIQQNCTDSRVRVIFHSKNQGVGGAVISGYRAAIKEGADIVVKIDGDGQMDPAFIPTLIRPLVERQADYTKGDRFYLMEFLRGMPFMRKMGNAMLSFLNKFSTGYWNVFDPTNGYTAIHTSVAADLPLDKISRRYFFESDMLFQLSIIRAVVKDVPMRSVYQGEVSSLRINKIAGEFMVHHCSNFVKRVFYSYFIRNFTLGSLELVCGLLLLVTGITVGAFNWSGSVNTGIAATAGTVMLSALPIALGIQLILAFLGEDISMVPKVPLSLNREVNLIKMELVENSDGEPLVFSSRKGIDAAVCRKGNRSVSVASRRET
ncbi:MAG: glycosyltransferase family 2 protein [Chitinispirillaceae bacterium]